MASTLEHGRTIYVPERGQQRQSRMIGVAATRIKARKDRTNKVKRWNNHAPSIPTPCLLVIFLLLSLATTTSWSGCARQSIIGGICQSALIELANIFERTILFEKLPFRGGGCLKPSLQNSEGAIGCCGGPMHWSLLQILHIECARWIDSTFSQKGFAKHKRRPVQLLYALEPCSVVHARTRESVRERVQWPFSVRIKINITLVGGAPTKTKLICLEKKTIEGCTSCKRMCCTGSNTLRLDQHSKHFILFDAIKMH